jgi:1-acyl-sn-glycerol-3-phosphate acyltransferase
VAVISTETELHGYDVFGREQAFVHRALRWLQPLYRHYFRVVSHGSEHVPRFGPAILVPNHGGTLPVDALMLWMDVTLRTGRTLRPIMDRFIPLLPIASTAFARGGAVTGTRTNVRHLLECGELIAIFPEGTTGPAKPFRERYRLQDWRVGHAELAIRHRAPVVPIAIVGAEEAWPVLARLRRLRVFGAPYLPIPAAPLPLPMRIEIHYGRPLALHPGLPPQAADDPAIVHGASRQTRAAVIDLLDRALAKRRAS